MNKKLVTFAAAVLVLVALILGGYLIVDSRSGIGSRAGNASGAVDPNDGSARASAASSAPGAPAAPALSPAEQQAIREALEKSAREEGERDMLFRDVAQPWPKSEALATFRWCVERSTEFAEGRDASARGESCACATRAIQRRYPEKPPPRRARNADLRFKRAVIEEAKECLP